jgi:site-specific DNA-methyltransferase (adenine-specific)
MNLPKPYYQHAGQTIYHGDCKEILPLLSNVDLVLTDPPYSDAYVEEFQFSEDVYHVLDSLKQHAFVFWSATADFPLSWSAIHIWDKKVGCGSMYERVFERHGGKNCRVFNHHFINSTVSAQMTRDVFTGHPTQKPIKLICEIMQLKPNAQIILDPFLGSGTTLVASKQLGRQGIGIEINERYCEIASRRLSQEVMDFS